jgi:hypothetical protein
MTNIKTELTMNPLQGYTDKQLREELDRRGYFVDELFHVQDVQETIDELEIKVGMLTFVGKQAVLEKAYKRGNFSDEMVWMIQEVLEQEYS